MRTRHAKSSGHPGKGRDSFSEKRQLPLPAYDRGLNPGLLAGDEIDESQEAEAEVKLMFALRPGNEP